MKTSMFFSCLLSGLAVPVLSNVVNTPAFASEDADGPVAKMTAIRNLIANIYAGISFFDTTLTNKNHPDHRILEEEDELYYSEECYNTTEALSEQFELVQETWSPIVSPSDFFSCPIEECNGESKLLCTVGIGNPSLWVEFNSNFTDFCESNDARVVYFNYYLEGDCFAPELGVVSVDYYIIPRCFPNICTDDDVNAATTSLITSQFPPSCSFSIEMSDMTFPKKPKGCSFIWEEQSVSKTPKASKTPKMKKMTSKLMKAGV